MDNNNQCAQKAKNASTPTIKIIPEIEEHPAIQYSSGTLTLRLEFSTTSVEGIPCTPTSLPPLLKIIPSYAPYVTTLRISIHTPIPTPETYNSQVEEIKNLIPTLSLLGRVFRVDARAHVEEFNFSQIKLLASLFALHDNVNFSFVETGKKPMQIQYLGDVGRRLWGVYMQESMGYADSGGEM